MKQLITRLDEGLHAQLRERAASEGTSVNRLVTEAIERLLAADDDAAVDDRTRIRARARLLGLLALRPVPPVTDAQRAATIAATIGVGAFASDALDADRGPR